MRPSLASAVSPLLASALALLVALASPGTGAEAKKPAKSKRVESAKEAPSPGAAAEAARKAAASPQAAVYARYLQAVAAADLDGLRGVAGGKMGEQVGGGEGYYWVVVLQDLQPEKIEYLDLTAGEKEATLKVKGEKEGVPKKGEITFVLEGGAWKVSEHAWSR